MPVVHSERIANASSSKSSGFASTSAQSKLRGITEIELKAWRKAVNDPAILSYDFFDLHEIFDYPFKVGGDSKDTTTICYQMVIFFDRIMTPSGSISRKPINGV